MPTAWLDQKGLEMLGKMRDGEQGEVPNKGGKMKWMEVLPNHVSNIMSFKCNYYWNMWWRIIGCWVDIGSNDMELEPYFIFSFCVYIVLSTAKTRIWCICCIFSWFEMGYLQLHRRHHIMNPSFRRELFYLSMYVCTVHSCSYSGHWVSKDLRRSNSSIAAGLFPWKELLPGIHFRGNICIHGMHLVRKDVWCFWTLRTLGH